MPAGAPLVDFKANLTHTRSNLRDLRGEVGNLETLVNGAQQALQTPARIESQATEFISTVRSMKFSLKVLEKVGPLKIVAKAVNNVLDELEDVAVRIRTKASDLDDRPARLVLFHDDPPSASPLAVGPRYPDPASDVNLRSPRR